MGSFTIERYEDYEEAGDDFLIHAQRSVEESDFNSSFSLAPCWQKASEKIFKTSTFRDLSDLPFQSSSSSSSSSSSQSVQLTVTFFIETASIKTATEECASKRPPLHPNKPTMDARVFQQVLAQEQCLKDYLLSRPKAAPEKKLSNFPVEAGTSPA